MVSESRLFVLLEDFEHKIFDLTERIAQQRQRTEQLERENEDLQNTIREQQNQLKQQQKKAVDTPPSFTKSKDFGKLVSSNLPDAVAREEVKQKLDEYIRDLDRCIAHLSTLS
jgi:predicted  nucleic acid-binding Zn-ribbon protein